MDQENNNIPEGAAQPQPDTQPTENAQPQTEGAHIPEAAAPASTNFDDLDKTPAENTPDPVSTEPTEANEVAEQQNPSALKEEHPNIMHPTEEPGAGTKKKKIMMIIAGALLFVLVLFFILRLFGGGDLETRLDFQTGDNTVNDLIFDISGDDVTIGFQVANAVITPDSVVGASVLGFQATLPAGMVLTAVPTISRGAASTDCQQYDPVTREIICAINGTDAAAFTNVSFTLDAASTIDRSPGQEWVFTNVEVVTDSLVITQFSNQTDPNNVIPVPVVGNVSLRIPIAANFSATAATQTFTDIGADDGDVSIDSLETVTINFTATDTDPADGLVAPTLTVNTPGVVLTGVAPGTIANSTVGSFLFDPSLTPPANLSVTATINGNPVTLALDLIVVPHVHTAPTLVVQNETDGNANVDRGGTIQVDEGDSVTLVIFATDIDETDSAPARISAPIISGIIPNPAGGTVTETLQVDTANAARREFTFTMPEAGGTFDIAIAAIADLVPSTAFTVRLFSPAQALAPAAITDLTASNPTTTTIDLAWTAPGDDGVTGTATSYEIKRAAAAIIDEADWTAATTVPNTLAGTAEAFTVTGLDASTTYFFAVRASDEVPNQALLSNSPSETTAAVVVSTDTTAPAPIINLSIPAASPTDRATLTWTAVGDDGNTGTATTYDIRYSTTGPIINATWDAATTTAVTGEPAPRVAGTTGETFTVTGLTQDTNYYFAIKAIDEAGNEPDLFGTATASTVTTLQGTDGADGAAGTDGADGTAADVVAAAEADYTIVLNLREETGSPNSFRINDQSSTKSYTANNSTQRFNLDARLNDESEAFFIWSLPNNNPPQAVITSSQQDASANTQSTVTLLGDPQNSITVRLQFQKRGETTWRTRQVVIDRAAPVIANLNVGGQLRGAAAQCQFTDISNTLSFIREAILNLCNLGIVKGYADKTFKPNNNINRAELVKILVEGFHRQQINNSFQGRTFFDVPTTEWYTKYVEAAQRLTVVGGYPDGSFKPGRFISRAEVAKVLVTASKDPQVKSLYEQMKSQHANAEWYVPYYKAIESYTGQKFPTNKDWGSYMNRGEIAYWLNLLITQ